ncbi:hypothetical protein HOLleu_44214 [Holothuria leucospilota]|uniref:Uncharacterized protein n=1 Tax=Holothuria leucospilota TaxID=206669 RepID=A0A9Q0YAV3_HOLLE|nr:hypothetical protein HOLleu_44214 [Holothuria leucospilota]
MAIFRAVHVGRCYSSIRLSVAQISQRSVFIVNGRFDHIGMFLCYCWNILS